MGLAKLCHGKPMLLDFVKPLVTPSSASLSATLFDHCEAVVNFENSLKIKVEGQYRKKKLPCINSEIC